MTLPIIFRTHPRRRTGFAAPLATLSSPVDALFEDLLRGNVRSVSGQAVAPRIDLVETDTELRVSAELPGLAADEIGVELKEGTLRIRGEKAAVHAGGEGVGWHRAERKYGSFERSVRIPVEVDAETATASYRNGVLEIALPKAASAKAREIPVEVVAAS